MVVERQERTSPLLLPLIEMMMEFVENSSDNGGTNAAG
jgi:hypothetical protein